MYIFFQDNIHKASNLLCPSAGLHWTSAPGSKSKCITVELEMAKLTKIAQIEVGKSYCQYDSITSE